MRQFTGYCLYKVAVRLRSRMDELLKDLGLVAPQCGMLALLNRVGPMTQIELGNHMAIDKATMVRFLDGLQKKKLITRIENSKDRRAKVLQVTSAGTKLLNAIAKVRDQVENEIFANLTKKEFETLRALIAKVSLA